MAFSYNKLRGRIREKFDTQEKFAEAIGMSKTTLSLKLNNVTEFSQGEIIRAMNALEIPASLLEAYFFTTEVQKSVLSN